MTQTAGLHYTKPVIIKKFRSDDGFEHEFTTVGAEGERSGAVIAITPSMQVVVAYQFRAGPEKWMYELPGGAINPGENPEAGVMRELREETGYAPGQVTYLGVSSRAAYINTMWHYFLATGCVAAENARHLDKEEADQGMEVHLISIAELIDYAKHDNMTDPAAVLMAYDQLQAIGKEK